MRKVLLSCLLFLFATTASEVFAFEMTEMQLWFSEDAKAHQTNIYTLDVVNDTVIEGKHYYPLSIQEGDGSEVAGYLREEEKRVYFVYKGDREESLLYDFGMEVGSSVEVGRSGAQQLMTCVEVDSIYTSFGWLRRQRMMNDDITSYGYKRPAYWLEGVGSDLGPLFPFGWGRDGFNFHMEWAVCNNGSSFSYTCFFDETKDFSFVEGSPYWRFEQHRQTQSGDKYSTTFWFYIPEGNETVINGKTYKKMLYGKWRDREDPQGIPATYLLALREKDGRVYANLDQYKDAMKTTGLGNVEDIPYHVTEDGEVILYDFNMQEGDMFRHTLCFDDVYVEKVSSSDDAYNRKNYELSNGIKILEGRGASNSAGMLLAYLNPQEKEVIWNQLSAYGRKGVYIEYGVDGGSSLIDISDIVTDGIPVTVVNRNSSNATYDLSGRKISTSQHLNLSARPIWTLSSERTLPKGVYIQNGHKFVVK